jgi:beta-lactamase class A
MSANDMRVIMASFLILGLASRSQIWNFGLCSPHRDPGSFAGAVFRPLAGDYIKKWSMQKAAIPAEATPTHLLHSKTQTFDTPPRQTSLQHFIQHLVDSLHAEIGVAFRDLETGKEFFFNEHQMMHAASTMKVPVMIEVFRQAEQGKFRLDDSLMVKNQFNSIVDSSSYNLDVGDDSDESIYSAIGKNMTIRRLVEQMITVSSNLATNILIELVGAEKVMATLREVGVKNMQVRRGVEDIKAYHLGLNNQTDAFDMMLALQALAEKRAASPAACDTMLAILQRQKFRDGIPAGLPAGTVVANKTGSITAIAHDCAIVFPESPEISAAQKKSGNARKPYLLVVLTSGIQEEKTAQRAIAAISQEIYRDLVTSL